MPTLTLSEALTVITVILAVASIIWANKWETARLKKDLEAQGTRFEYQLRQGQDESLRQLKALHNRLDDHAKRLRRREVRHAILAERVNHLRDTRFRLVPVPAPGESAE